MNVETTKAGAYRFAALVALFGLAGGAGCSSEPVASEGSAPTIDEAALAVQDEATDYDGWAMYPLLSENCIDGTNGVHLNVQRTSGDSTRGGGSCFARSTGASCSSDTTCTSAAQAAYGSLAYGYCFQGSCYSRPGDANVYCARSPNITTSGGYGGVYGVLPSSSVQYDGFDVSLGCLTKTAGPNTACGGTNGSLYIRWANGGIWPGAGCW
jgi:hypothetical protein